MKKVFDAMFKRKDGTFTLTKVGGWLAAFSGAVIAVCALPLHTIHIPMVVQDLGMIAGTLGVLMGAGTTVAGFRNAMDKK